MISSEQALIRYTLTTSGQVLPIPFVFLQQGDIGAIQTRAGVDTVLILNTDYTISGGGILPATGNLTMVAGVAADVITIYRTVAETQTTGLTTNGPFPAKTIETTYDRLVMIDQRLQLGLGQTLRFPISNSAPPEMTLSNRAGKIPAFDTNGGLIWLPNTANPQDVGNSLVTATGSTAPTVLADRFAQHYSAMDWGARGDGTTDDSGAINAALAFVKLASSRGTVFLPGGRIYLVTSTLVIPDGVILDISGAQINASGVGANTVITFGNRATLIGYGAIIQPNGAGTALRKTDQGVAGKFDIIGWPYIIPTIPLVALSIGLDLTACYRGVIQVNIAQFAKGIFCDGSTVNAYSIRLDYSIIEGCGTGMQFAGAKINDLTIHSPYINGSGTGTYGIIRTGAAVTFNMFGGYIEGFDTASAATRAMVIQDATAVRVYGTTFDTGPTVAAQFAIEISGSADNVELDVDFAGGFNSSTKTITHTASGRYSLKTTFAGVPIRLWGHMGAPLLTQTNAFTPGIAGTTVAGTPTYTQQTGKATKRGPNVHVEILLAISAKTGISGALNLTGLPYAIKTGTTPVAVFSDTTGLGFPASCTQLIGVGGVSSSTTIRLQGIGSGVGPSNVTDASLLAASSIKVSIDYLTDA